MEFNICLSFESTFLFDLSLFSLLFYRLTIGSQCGKISYKTGTTERGSLFNIEKYHDSDSIDISDNMNEEKNYCNEGKIVKVDEERNLENSRQENYQRNDDNDNKGDLIDNNATIKSKNKNNKFRLKSLLSLKNTNISNFTPYLHVRSDGQLSCEVDVKNKNELFGVFYMKIIPEIKEFDFSNIGVKNNNNCNNNKNGINDQVCHNKDRDNNDSDDDSNSYSPIASQTISNTELKEFYENGFLKISNGVDRSHINTCLR